MIKNLTPDQLLALQVTIYALAASGPLYLIWLGRKIMRMEFDA